MPESGRAPPGGEAPVAFEFKADGTTLTGYKGVVSANEIKITAELMGMPFEFVVKKN